MALAEKINMFNVIVGNPAPTLDDIDEFWEKVQLQSKLILEEAQEQYDAAMNKNIVEVVDGWGDVEYLQTWQEEILKNVGVLTQCALDAICLNNLQKFTKVKGFAEDSKTALIEDGVECYIQETVFEGETYYTVRRKSDGKVQKLLRHVPPNIPSVIDSNTLKVLESSK